MCFSATASFTAGVVLLTIGTVTTRRARQAAEWPFALIPVLFGVQQLLEGALWLTFPDKAPFLNTVLTQLYSLFSQIIWPIYIPVAVLLLEPSKWRRKVLGAITLAGCAVSVFLLYYLVRQPVLSRVQGRHISYFFPHLHQITATGFYLLGACISPLFSSHRSVQLFGAAATLSLIATAAFYTTWFISVWCFFAAILSGIVFLHFPRTPEPLKATA
jgi:hypothetical protein